MQHSVAPEPVGKWEGGLPEKNFCCVPPLFWL